MKRPKSLGVWLRGVRIANIKPGKPGEIKLRYTEEALDLWPLNTPLLSCSLPLSNQNLQASFYFRGLLPEGDHLQSLAARANVTTVDTFGLLDRYGKDVAGAVIISEEDPGARLGSIEPYTSVSLANEVAELPTRHLGVYDDSELSLPGLQDKLLLVSLPDNGWARPLHGSPSTHILKTEDRRHSGMAEMEVACLQLARAVNLTNVNVTLEKFDNIPCLIVSRYDRTIDAEGDILRIHQEDLCQALGRDADKNERKGKYEFAGGPSLFEAARLIDRYASDSLAELKKLIRITVFTTLIGNADAHGKNIALLHGEPGSVEIAPLYDTVPTALWPKLRRKAAMRVGGNENILEITVDDVIKEAVSWQFEPSLAKDEARTFADEVLSALSRISVPSELEELVRSRAANFLVGNE
jgi:serine/threonine-protein kinase HipA